jgi:hypothetical protein
VTDAEHPPVAAGSPEGSGAHSMAFAQPLAWLSVAIAGLVLVGVGVAIDAVRYHHGASAGALIGGSSPGFLVALAGFGVTAVGLLIALTLLAFDGATSDRSMALRSAGVFVGWTLVACAGLAGVTAAASGLVVGRSGDASTANSVVRPAPTSTQPAPTAVPGMQQRVTLSGALTVDGRSVDSRFLGAYVIRDGLVTPCQVDIPAVTAGRYEIAVIADAEGRGCGAPGAQVLLWTAVDNSLVYSRETLAWPAVGVAAATFDATFAAAAPQGALPPLTGFKGHAVSQDGTRLPGGTVVEAFVGGTRCGVTSVRRSDGLWFTLLVSGPQVSGCAKDGQITFRVDGAGVPDRATNNLSDNGLTIELTAN